MHTRKIGIMMPVAIVISMVFGVILAARGTLDSLDGQTTSTTRTSTTQAAATTTTAEEKSIPINTRSYN
jgi:K+-transporting ATPase A subunit